MSNILYSSGLALIVATAFLGIVSHVVLKSKEKCLHKMLDNEYGAKKQS